MQKWYLLYSKKDRGHEDFYLVLQRLQASDEGQARTEADRLWSQLIGAEMRVWAELMQIDRAHAGTALSHGPREPRLMCESERPYRYVLREPPDGS